MTITNQTSPRADSRAAFSRAGAACACAAAVALVARRLRGCTGEQFQKGYILPPGALEQIPIGASQDQVLIVMGTPSTVATLNGEVFYYISQRAERPVAFMNQKVVDQRVIAVYFDKNRQRAPACQLRPAGRQDLRLHQPHHADLGPGDELPARRCSSCSASTRPSLRRLRASRAAPTSRACRRCAPRFPTLPAKQKAGSGNVTRKLLSRRRVLTGAAACRPQRSCRDRASPTGGRPKPSASSCRPRPAARPT